MNPTRLVEQLAQQVGAVTARVDAAELQAAAREVHAFSAPRSDRPAVILEAAELRKLGTAAGRTYFAHGDGELRVDLEVGPEAAGDNLPPHRLLIHATQRVPDQLIEEPGEHLWSKSKRRRVEGHQVDRWWRCTIVPAGTFAATAARYPDKKPKPAPRPKFKMPAAVGIANQDAIAFWRERRR